MTRDSDQSSAFVFDLVEQDAAGPGAPRELRDTETGDPHDADGAGAPDRDEPEQGEPPASGAPAGRWRTAATVAAVLAIALGTGIASDGARDNTRIERMRDIQGGLADVSAPLAEKWTWDGTVGADDLYNPGQDVAVLGDVLLVESDDELVALNPATGKEEWTVPHGGDSVCGPMGDSAYGETPAVSPSVVVCLRGTGDDREVMTVGPDGMLSAPRTLDPSEARRYGPPRAGPDGTVLRAKRVGPASAIDLGAARCEEFECTGRIEAGRDVELRAEDAVTGEERWSVTIPFRAAESDQCWGRSWEDPANSLSFDGTLYPDAFGARVTADLVQLDGCGVAADVTPDGVLLGSELGPDMGELTSLGAGGYAELDYSDGTPRTILYTDDGGVAVVAAGYVTGPGVADGSGPATWLATDDSGQNLRAYEPDGTPRWNTRVPADTRSFLAQVGETVVIRVGDAAAGTAEGSAVRGLDVATGDERWRWDAPADVDDVLRTFTDGRSVLLLLTRGDSGDSQMVSLDAATGEELWARSDEAAAGNPDDQEPATLVAVDGNLLEVSRAGVRGLG